MSGFFKFQKEGIWRSGGGIYNILTTMITAKENWSERREIFVTRGDEKISKRERGEASRKTLKD